MAENKKNIVGFKRFTDMNSKSKIEEVDASLNVTPDSDSNLPANPNLPSETKKMEKPASVKNLMPFDKEDIDIYDENDEDEANDTKNESRNVETFGKVAKFPKNVKASKAFNFLEKVKISKKSIWYIMVEKQVSDSSNILQMVKYNNKEGIDLNQFVNELKSYYLSKYSGDIKTCKLIENIKIEGNDNFSTIANIPLIKLDGTKMITRITEDLIKLLSK